MNSRHVIVQIYQHAFARRLYNILRQDPRWGKDLISSAKPWRRGKQSNTKNKFKFDARVCKGGTFRKLLEFMESIGVMAPWRKKHFYKWIVLPLLNFLADKRASIIKQEVAAYKQMHKGISDDDAYSQILSLFMTSKFLRNLRESLDIIDEDPEDFAHAAFPKHYPKFPKGMWNKLLYSKSEKEIKDTIRKMYIQYFNEQTYLIKGIYSLVELLIFINPNKASLQKIQRDIEQKRTLDPWEMEKLIRYAKEQLFEICRNADPSLQAYV